MRLCPYCKTEVSGIGAGDESLDFCIECDVLVEGNTIDSGDEELEQAKQFEEWAAAIDLDEDWISNHF